MGREDARDFRRRIARSAAGEREDMSLSLVSDVNFLTHATLLQPQQRSTQVKRSPFFFGESLLLPIFSIRIRTYVVKSAYNATLSASILPGTTLVATC